MYPSVASRPLGPLDPLDSKLRLMGSPEVEKVSPRVPDSPKSEAGPELWGFPSDVLVLPSGDLAIALGHRNR